MTASIVVSLVPMPRHVVSLLLLLGCGSAEDLSTVSLEIGIGTGAILDGDDAAHRTGVVYLEHVAGTERCTGALVAPNVVLTAAHCVFPADGVSSAPLAAGGFRVGFGPTTDKLELRNVEMVLVPNEDEPMTLSERVARGLDVAALVLEMPVAQNDEVYHPALGFHPTTQTSLELVGFGISSAETGESGQKLSAASQVIGWDRSLGVLELDGKGACLGDSGGPALDEAGRWVGLVSSVSTNDEVSPCGGRTFLNTVLNADVEHWLVTLTGSTDGGAPVDPEEEQPEPEPAEPSGDDDPAELGGRGNAQPEAGSPYGSCATSGGNADGGGAWLWLVVAFLAAARGRAKERCGDRVSRMA